MEPLSLHAAHQALGARFTSLKERELVAAYAPLAQELSALREGAALYDASARELLELRGEDRASFLHGMVTNDVNKLPSGRATYAAMLTNKGAMVADMRIWNTGGVLLLDLEPGYGATVKSTLERYLISEDAELQDATSRFAVLWLGGPKTFEVLRAALGVVEPPPPGETRVSVGGEVEVFALGDGLVAQGSVVLLIPRTGLAKVWEALRAAGATPVGFEALEAARISAGVPRFGQDMDETTIPLEAELKRAIDYQKGCYIGQEVIARGTFRGQMARKLSGLVLGGAALPPPRAELYRGEKKVGWITSAVKLPDRAEAIALGYVHRDSLTPGTALEVKGHPDPATVHALPF